MLPQRGTISNGIQGYSICLSVVAQMCLRLSAVSDFLAHGSRMWGVPFFSKSLLNPQFRG